MNNRPKPPTWAFVIGLMHWPTVVVPMYNHWEDELAKIMKNL